ncbi:glycosyltransferase family 2 protein, partial [Ascoidea rubescens DSM 1968]
GNLVLDCPISEDLLEKYTGENGKPPTSHEFGSMRYQAVTCEPDQFEDQNYQLRPNLYTKERETELLIAITMYNEEEYLLAKTLKGVFQNIIHLSNLKNSEVWGENSWKKIVVCIISDGRSKINPKSQALLASLGVFQTGLAKNKVGKKDVKLHLYEHTTMLGIRSTEENNITFVRFGIPIQLMFCLKEKNQQKINSHRWCFQAFCKVLQPNVIVLLDAGTQPSETSIYHLWNEFYLNDNVGGACGEIKVALGRKWKNLLNPLIAAQNFEYKISNILDKPMESVFGYISVLPGAFSAYRYKALLNDPVTKKGPLDSYFKKEMMEKHNISAGFFDQNMYLAEDRILCFELVFKNEKLCYYEDPDGRPTDTRIGWVSKYVKSAKAETDTPASAADLTKQRRRWLNGSFFAAVFAVTHFYKIWTSSHSFSRKLIIQIEMIYQLISLIISWFAIGSFFLIFRILTSSLEDYFSGADILGGIFLWFYLACLAVTVILSFGNRPDGTRRVYTVMFLFYGILMVYTMFASIYLSVKSIQDFELARNFNNLVFENSRFRDLVVSMSCTIALFYFASFVYFEPWHMFTCFIQYMVISPVYMNILNIYAFVNMHDISWGTREEADKTDLGKDNVDEEYIVALELPSSREDVRKEYMKNHYILNEKVEKKKIVNKEEERKDYYALVRSGILVLWTFTNVVIVVVVLTQDGFTSGANLENIERKRSEIFLTVILWLVAFMTGFRFLGSMLYLVFRMFKQWEYWTVKRELRYRSNDKELGY